MARPLRILMTGMPRKKMEMPYRQEYYCGTAEDWGKLVAKGVTVTVPFGTFENCIKTVEASGQLKISKNVI